MSVGGTSITADGETQDGLFNWVAGGADQLSQQWIWLRPSGQNAETSLNNLTLVTSDASGNTISLAYQGSGLGVAVRYALTGGAVPRIDETIVVTNLGTTTTSLALFVYSDLDINGNPEGDSATGGVTGIAQTDANTTVTVRPVGILPDHFEIAFFPDLLDLLNDGATTTLGDSGSGLGPSDLSHAFQWDLTLDAGETLTLALTKEFTQVPWPQGAILIAVAFAGAVALRTRRRA